MRRGNCHRSGRNHGNPIEPISSPGQRLKKSHSLVALPKDHASATQSAAYAELLKARKGTSAYDRALSAFVLELFPDSNPPAVFPSWGQTREAINQII